MSALIGLGIFGAMFLIVPWLFNKKWKGFDKKFQIGEHENQKDRDRYAKGEKVKEKKKKRKLTADEKADLEEELADLDQELKERIDRIGDYDISKKERDEMRKEVEAEIKLEKEEAELYAYYGIISKSDLYKYELIDYNHKDYNFLPDQDKKATIIIDGKEMKMDEDDEDDED